MQAISAGHEVTLDVARQVLQDGGNAFDAAIAAYAAACIAEPCMASAGAGACAHIYQKGQAPTILDFFCQTPKHKLTTSDKDFWPIPVDFGDVQETYYGGMAAIAVPGAIAGLYALHSNYATRPMKVLLEPAIALAKEGVAINKFQHYDLSLLHTVFDHEPRAKELFKPTGDLIEVGHKLKLPQFADFLDFLSSEGPNAFYKGEVARKLINDCVQKGGFLTMSDLENYHPIIRKPIKCSLKDFTIYNNPLPAIGGPLMTVGLDILQNDTSESESVLVKCFEAMEKMEKSPTQLAGYLEGRNRRGATSHFNIVDRWGNAIALTMTLGEGAGYFIPGTDIHMNNMLGEKSLVPQGWHKWRPETRLSTMMSPTLAFNKKEELVFVAGSGGASRIPGAILQVLHYHLMQGLDIRAAVQAPRLHLEDGQLDMEPGLSPERAQQAASIAPNLWSKESMFFGGVHSIAKKGEAWEATGDQRRDGVAWVG